MVFITFVCLKSFVFAIFSCEGKWNTKLIYTTYQHWKIVDVDEIRVYTNCIFIILFFRVIIFNFMLHVISNNNSNISQNIYLVFFLLCWDGVSISTNTYTWSWLYYKSSEFKWNCIFIIILAIYDSCMENWLNIWLDIFMQFNVKEPLYYSMIQFTIYLFLVTGVGGVNCKTEGVFFRLIHISWKFL